jgi:hypothetical protein
VSGVANVKCEIRKKEKYFKNKDPGDQQNLIVRMYLTVK